MNWKWLKTFQEWFRERERQSVLRRQCQVTFTEEGIEFKRYGLPYASVYPSGLLRLDQIREIGVDAAPPEVRTISGEILFLSATLRDELKQFAGRHGLPLVHRVDVWDLILEPFLDTEFTPEEQERTLSILEANGISRKECAELRVQFKWRMLAFNSSAWEWVHLGQEDLLLVCLATMRRKTYRRVYWQSMEIAGRAGIFTPPLR